MFQRKPKTLATLLGLFTLALQLLVSIGHHHDHHPSVRAWLGTAHKAAVAGAAVRAPEAGLSGQQDERDDDDEHGCDVCSALAMARVCDLPAPPVLSTRIVSEVMVYSGPPCVLHECTSPFAFQARGPPNPPLMS